MKIEIEITEAEIKSAIERKIRVAVADETNSYRADAEIKAMVKKHWADVAEKIVVEQLSTIPVMQEKIRKAVEAKLRGQLTVAMKGMK
jgi:hypothetical protein